MSTDADETLDLPRRERVDETDLVARAESPGRHPGLGRLGERFEVEGELGRGAWGVVLRVRETDTKRLVALKLLKDVTLDPEELARFQREGEIAAKLDHPGIVKVHSSGEIQGQPYLVYELVDGVGTLDEVLEGLGLSERVDLVRQAALALGHAHAGGSEPKTLVGDEISQELLGGLAHTSRIRGVVFSLDGRRLYSVSGGNDVGNDLRIWDVDTGRLLGVALRVSSGRWSSIDLSSDGKRILLTRRDADRIEEWSLRGIEESVR